MLEVDGTCFAIIETILKTTTNTFTNAFTFDDDGVIAALIIEIRIWTIASEYFKLLKLF